MNKNIAIPETFPGLKISPKCVCRPRWGAQSAPRPIIYIKGGERKGKEGKEEERQGRKKNNSPQTKSLATTL